MKNYILALLIIALSATTVFGGVVETPREKLNRLRSLAAQEELTKSINMVDKTDYTITFSECKFVLASIEHNNTGIIEDKGEKLNIKCNKTGDGMSCAYENEYIYSTPVTYTVEFGTEKYLYFYTDKEYIALNKEDNTAALTHRIITSKYIGQKICFGTFKGK